VLFNERLPALNELLYPATTLQPHTSLGSLTHPAIRSDRLNQAIISCPLLLNWKIMCPSARLDSVSKAGCFISGIPLLDSIGRQAAPDEPFSQLFHQPDPEIHPFIRKFCGF
jgi:hypothetical protein